MELFTPTFEQSLRFFTELLSMDVVEAGDDFAYLRTWDDYELFSLRLVARQDAGVGRVGLRTASPTALQDRVKAIEAEGSGGSWGEGLPGRGDTYSFSDPDGHPLDLYFDSTRFSPSDEVVPALKN